MLDNSDILPRLVKESGAHSTDLESPVNVQDETDKCRARAAAWAVCWLLWLYTNKKILIGRVVQLCRLFVSSKINIA